MNFILDFDTADLLQPFTVKTDLENTKSIVCAYTPSLIAPPAYAQLIGSSLKITASLLLPAHVGPNYITVRATSTLYPGSVFTVDYKMTFTVSFCATSTFAIPAIPNMDFIIAQGSTDHSYIDATFSNLACLYTVTHTASYDLFGLSIPKPSFITFLPASSKFTVNSISPIDLGVYTLTVTATIPQPSVAAGIL
jgi:hypothetical protein